MRIIVTCAWCFWGRLRGRLFILLGFEVSHTICDACLERNREDWEN